MSPMPKMTAEAIMINVLFQIIHITIKKMSGENLIIIDDVDISGLEDKYYENSKILRELSFC